MANYALTQDLTGAISQAFYVAVFDLDGGQILVSNAPGVLDGKSIIAGVSAWNSVSADAVSFTADIGAFLGTAVGALTDPATFLTRYGHWMRRPARVYEVPMGVASVLSGRQVFVGIVNNDPTYSDGGLTFSLSPALQRMTLVPPGPPVGITSWPSATDQALGVYPPTIYGTVDDSTLLPVSQPINSKLAAAANAGDTSITLADSSGFPASGSILIDSTSYLYTSNDLKTQLFGLTILGDHASGTSVSVPGPWVFLAANHPLVAINSLYAHAQTDTVITEGVVDLAAATVTFSTPPKYVSATSRYTEFVEFDQVAAPALDFSYDVTYSILSQVDSTHIYYGNLSTYLYPPDNVTAGVYVFHVRWAAQPDTGVTNPGAYLCHLGGVAFAIGPNAGTVAVSVTVTGNSPIALTHFVNGGYAQILPLITNATVTWTAASIPNPAFNPLNAIRAITNLPSGTTQSAGYLPTVVNAQTANNAILFNRPHGNDGIVDGTYTVAFTVTSTSIGHCTVKIGSQVLWVSDGGSLVFNGSGSSWADNTDADVMPVVVDTAGVTVVITAAQRTVLTGHLGNSDFATLSTPYSTTFQAVQTTVNPDRGVIDNVSLVVEWFCTDALTGALPVTFGGLSLGNLALTNTSGSTVNHTVAVDHVVQGNANLQAASIATFVSGGTASLNSYVTHSVPQTYSVAFTEIAAARTYGLQVSTATLRIIPPNNVASGDHIVTVKWSGGAAGPVVGMVLSLSDDYDSNVDSRPVPAVPNGFSTSTIHIPYDSSTVAVGYRIQAVTGINIPGNTYIPTSPPSYVVDMGSGFAAGIKPLSVQIDWQVRPLAVSSVPASGGTTIANHYPPNQNIDVVLSGGNVSITVPAPPRTIISEFPLPSIKRWDDMTGKTVNITYVGGGISTTSVGLAHVYLKVGYDQPAYSLAGTSSSPLKGTIVGYSGNPADILLSLATSVGEVVDTTAYNIAKNWFTSNSWAFSRRIGGASSARTLGGGKSGQTEATTLLQRAADQALVLLARTSAGLAFIRQLDLSFPTTTVTDADLLAPASIEWVDPSNLFNEITLTYREVDDATTRAYTRNASTPDLWAALGQSQLGGDRQTTNPEGLWIRDDVTAMAFSAGFLALNAAMRRMLTLRLSRGAAVSGAPNNTIISLIEPGALVYYAALPGVTFRVLKSVKDSEGNVTLTCAEIPEMW